MLKKISPRAQLLHNTRIADFGPNVDKAPRPSISNFIWVLSSDNIYQCCLPKCASDFPPANTRYLPAITQNFDKSVTGVVKKPVKNVFCQKGD